MPALVAVLLQGNEAQSSWKRLAKRHPSIAHRPRLVVPSFHPSSGALQTPDPVVRAARIQPRQDAWHEVGAALAEADRRS